MLISSRGRTRTIDNNRASPVIVLKPAPKELIKNIPFPMGSSLFGTKNILVTDAAKEIAPATHINTIGLLG
jgi:hypothetical protein